MFKSYYFNPRLGEEQIGQSSKEENNFTTSTLVQERNKKEIKKAIRDIVPCRC